MVLSITSVITVCEIWYYFEFVYYLRDTMFMMTVSSRFYLFKIREGESVDQFVLKFILFRLRLV